jgi:large subunit ribosomal protein L21
MFSRPALRALFSVERAALFSSRPQACLLHQTSTASSQQNFQATPADVPPPSITITAASAELSQELPSQSNLPPLTTLNTPHNKLPLAPAFESNLKLTPALASQLPHLQTQRPHYISAHLHDRPYLLTEGDHLRLPFLMPNVRSGDVLRFNRASLIGSRDFSLKGAPYIDERMFECRLRVLGVESEPLRIKEKTKRRRRHVQQVKSKHKYTVLRVMQVKVKSLEELLAEGATVEEDTLEGDVIEAKAEERSSS